MGTEGISDEARGAIDRAWPDMLARIAAGELVGPVLKDAGITRAMVRRYMLASPARRAEWDLAREESADAYFEEAISTAQSPIKADADDIARTRDPQHLRLYVDTLKWAAKTRNPRLYGDRAQLDVSVKTLDLTSIITAAQARLEAARPARVIDVRPLEDAARDLLEG